MTEENVNTNSETPGSLRHGDSEVLIGDVGPVKVVPKGHTGSRERGERWVGGDTHTVPRVYRQTRVVYQKEKIRHLHHLIVL